MSHHTHLSQAGFSTVAEASAKYLRDAHSREMATAVTNAVAILHAAIAEEEGPEDVRQLLKDLRNLLEPFQASVMNDKQAEEILDDCPSWVDLDYGIRDGVLLDGVFTVAHLQAIIVLKSNAMRESTALEGAAPAA